MGLGVEVVIAGCGNNNSIVAVFVSVVSAYMAVMTGIGIGIDADIGKGVALAIGNRSGDDLGLVKLEIHSG